MPRRHWASRHKTLAALIGMTVLILVMLSALVVVARILTDRLDHAQPIALELAHDHRRVTPVDGIADRDEARRPIR